MTATPLPDASAPRHDGPDQPPSLESLRSRGAQRFDPARFHYLEVMSRRVSQATGALRQILEDKLAAALNDYSQRVVRAHETPGAETAPQTAAGNRALADLNRYIRSASRQDSAEAQDIGEHREMKSVRRFRKTWTRISANDQVEQAILRGPENAGPLNSHMLVLRSLALMRTLSPDYLRRFMSHVDSLLWLDEQSRMPPKVKPVRPSRQKK